MARLFKTSWMVALIGGLLYLATTAAVFRSAQFEAPAGPVEVARSVEGEPSWNFRNPELEQWVDEVKHEKEALAQRTQQLQELQKRLDAERLEILAVTQAVHQLQSEFDKHVVRLKTQEMENLKRQAKIIASMSPEGAAAMLNEMPEDQTVGVLFLLKPDVASAILDTLSKMGKTEAKRAAELTERMRLVLPPGPGAPASG
jgi:flagellar motility protein MotE (MotC chaperone)